MTTSCKEKEAACEFRATWRPATNRPACWRRARLSAGAGSLSKDPSIQSNRFFKVAIGDAANWWTPPFAAKGWANYTDKIAPYWQQALRQDLTPAQWNAKAAALLRGED